MLYDVMAMFYYFLNVSKIQTDNLCLLFRVCSAEWGHFLDVSKILTENLCQLFRVCSAEWGHFLDIIRAPIGIPYKLF